jgi:membrane fusion protein, copper/silver efflux system
MNTKKLITGLAVLAAGISIGWGVAQWRATRMNDSPAMAGKAEGTGDRKVLYWYDPMVPTQKFDKPGKSPFMDMQLQPKYADEGGNADSGVSVSPQAIQSLGLRTASVERRSVAASIEAVGTVQLNERDVSVVQARSGGFVERVYARAPGDVISAGAPLVDLLMPEWVSAQREFLAVRALKDETLLAAARQRLQLLGMPPELVERVERSSEVQSRYTVTTPQGGLLAELMVRQGMTVSAGMSLARINGLGTVWLEAAVPEAQSGTTQTGQAAEVKLAAFPGETLKARVVSILPETNRESRTVRVRLEMANPGQRLKAGMTGQVSLKGPVAEALLVPSEAVIRTGKRAVVYVVDGPGKFHPVEVQIGAEIDDKLTILGGLAAGQQVVASSQFLIDSEASLKGVLPTMGATATSGPFTVKGVIQQLSATEMTLAHEAVPELQWPAMTMGFKLADRRLAQAAKPGQTVRFTFQKQGDDYVITRVEEVAR